MSGFGIRAFKKIVEHNHIKETNFFLKYIVYGGNTFAILTFLRLNKKYPGEVKLISQNILSKKSLLDEWSCTLNSTRSIEVAQALMEINPRFEFSPEQGDVLFYKDTKFHKFSSRAKPHELKDGESFFTNPSFEFNLEEVFDTSEFESLDATLEKHQLNKIISRIDVCEPADLIEKKNFELHTGEFESYSCEKIFFCESPKKFLSLVENKRSLSDELYRFAVGITNSQAVSVHFKSDREIFNKRATLLVPQSMTHDRGSFILDFEAFNSLSNTQSFKALAFISEDDLQEDDLAKKIKLLRRVTERIFPEMAKAQVEQTIRFSDEYRVLGADDTQFDELQKQNIQFLGQGAPIKHEHASKFQYMSRGIYSVLSASI